MRAFVFGICAVPALAAAEPAIELGAALGGHAFSSNAELGADDIMTDPGPSSSGLLGLRAAVRVIPRLAAEAELMIIPTQDDVLGDYATVYGFRGHARVDVIAAGKLAVFGVAGLGLHAIRGGAPQIDNDTDRSYHWGGGVRYALSRRLDARFDVRHLIVPDRTLDGATSDFESTLGVTYRFGGGGAAPVRRAMVVPAPAPVLPPRPGDQDGDGLLDNVDQCPGQAEDRDDFEDADGCVDPDNDRDGIVDQADRCPVIAETRNGWQDDDGCPDQVITELTGIAFELDSWKIDSVSAPLLERAYQILKQHPQLTVEISGHTSAEGNADKNLDLSLRRAQAVRAYLVKRGIPEARILTVGHGADVPIADNASEEGRRKNRRIEFRILRAEEVPQ